MSKAAERSNRVRMETVSLSRCEYDSYIVGMPIHFQYNSCVSGYTVCAAHV